MRDACNLVCALVAVFSFATARGAELIHLSDSQFADAIGDRDVAFYALDVSTGTAFAYRLERADERHAPWSTFKIPNLIIALETNVASSLSHERAWDQERRPAESYWPNEWKQDQTLETSFRRSAAWYFQDVAAEVGGARYRTALTAFGYGNAAAPDENDSFWLGGPLVISPREQVAFLERLILGGLDVGQSTIEAIRSVSLLSETNGYALRGKTGSGPVVPNDFDGAFEGWLVGWVERPDATAVAFALYVKGPSFDSIGGFRYQMSARFLRAIGALPAN
jgi:beta-lactamase class D